MHTFRAISVMVVLTGLVLTGCGSSGETELSEPVHLTNLAAMEQLTTHIGEEILSRYGSVLGTEIALDVDAFESSWIVSGALSRLILAGERKVLLSEPKGRPGVAKLAVRGAKLDVKYDNLRKPGFFAGVIVDRTVSVSFTAEIVNGGAVVMNEAFEKSYTDTVAEHRLAELENSSSPSTKGILPELNTIDRYVEPFVIIGATGAAIFLFFQIRS
jgi:hypothetical protein